MITPDRSIITNLGPLLGALPSSQNTSLSAQGIANWTAAAFTATTKVITGTPKNKVRRVKIVCGTAGITLAWKTVAAGATAPTVTAAGAGGADEGTLIPAGAVEEFSIDDAVDLYLCPSGAAVVQITMWEQ